MKHGFGLILVAMLAALPAASEEPAKPDVNKVIEEIAAVGPEALLARVKELKSAQEQLKKQAADLRKQADQKDAEAKQLQARIAAVEKFTSDLMAAAKPAEPKPAPEAKPAAQPAPEQKPAEQPKPEPAPEPKAEEGNQMGGN